jgi:hypothetical protein
VKGDGEEAIRTPSPRNPGQEKSPVQIKRRQTGTEVYLGLSNLPQYDSMLKKI